MSSPDTLSRIRDDITNLLKSNEGKQYRPQEIAKELGYKNDRLFRLFLDVVAQMDEEKEIERGKGNRYVYKGDGKPSPRPSSQVEALLHVKPQGYGFAEVEGQEEDIFVKAHHVETALDGDRVLLELFAANAQKDELQEGKVIEVLQRKRTQTVGTFKKQGHFAFVAPDDQRLTKDIYVPAKAFGGAEDGQKVLVSIDQYEDPKAAPEGRILAILGDSDDPKVRVEALAMSMDIVADFPEDVEQEADQISHTISDDEVERRLDLRGEGIFTIDPETAKDFDDAIHIKELPNGHREVGVHIADVSHYVQPDTALDEEAFRRATSVYLVDRTIPMLPPTLSNDICSLNPKEDKLAFSCIMEISPQGEVVDYEIRETVIRSKHRFTYEDAQTLIDGGHPDHEFAQDVVQAARLGRKLTRKRMREGSIDFDLPEVKVVLDDAGHPVSIKPKKRQEANRLIEEFMLLANRCVAHEIADKPDPRPFLYRIHDMPDGERIRQLANYVRAFGYQLELTDGNADSRHLNRLLTQVKGAPEEPVIEEAALRAMSKAVYSTNNIGHYGLGFPAYSHFTSPIRRYPDLIAHRLLKRYAQNGSNVDEAELQAQCEHCSEQERVAEQAERESVKLKQVEYAQNHVGDQFEGVVRGVTKFGVFVEINELLVEGLVHVRDMDDYFEYDEDTFTLVGTSSGRTFRPGDEVEVVIIGANEEKREIDLLFADKYNRS